MTAAVRPAAQFGQGEREVEDFGFDPGAVFRCRRAGQLRFQCRALAFHPRDDRLHLAPALGDALGIAIRVSLR